MLTRMLKIFFLQTVLILSLLLSACTDGDRGFISIPDAEIEEEPLPIVIKAGAVKGPLVNAEIGLYKLDLNSGLIKQHGDASEAFFRLLTEASVVINADGSSVIANDETAATTALEFIQARIKEIGYVTELPRLQNEVKDSLSVDEARLALDKYLNEASLERETNTIPKEEVQTIFDAFATLTELKSKISKLKPFITQLNELTTISSAESLIGKFRASETDSLKAVGWLAIQSEFRNATTSLITLRTDLSDLSLELSGDNKLELDAVALNRLDELESDVNNAATLELAESLITQAIIEEGNVNVRQSLSALKTSIISVDDFISQAQMDNALYHFSTIQNIILEKTSQIINQDGSPIQAPGVNPTDILNEMYLAVFNTLSVELEPSLADAYKNETLDIIGQPVNQIIKSISSDTSLLEGINLGDYSGFLYMEVDSINNTIDLNTGLKPIISKLNTIFHTDEIKGYGNNLKEDRTLFYLKDGQEQRDSDGVLITDESEIDKSENELVLEVQPYRFATPLTKLALAMVTERFKTFGPQLTDTNGDSELEYRVTASALKSELKAASNTIVKTFRLDELYDQSIYEAPAIFTLPMQYSGGEQEVAVQHRAMIESFSAFINTLVKETNLNVDTLFSAVVQDLLDDEMDGLEFDQKISDFNDVSDVAFLVQRSPEEVFIPGINKNIDKIADLMLSQLNIIEPEFPVQNLFTGDITFVPPLGGVDSDDDGYLNNSDAFPNDNTKYNDVDDSYSGVWGLRVANSLNYIAPLSGEVNFSINRITGPVEPSLPDCDNDGESCLFEGDSGSDFVVSWEVIRSPEAGNLLIKDTFNTDDAIGFNAIGSVAGVYQVRLTLITKVEPVQTYAEIIPIKIINPQDLVIRFNPTEPEAGKIVKVEFQATDDLCEVYLFCNEADVGNYFEITELDELQATWNLNGGESKQYRTFDFDPDVDDSASVHLQYFNSSKGDTLNIDVVYSAGSAEIGFVEFIAAQLTKIVGLNTDSDNDEINDEIDSFPNNSGCYLETDGFVNELGEEKCSYNFINNETTSDTTTLNIPFNNQTWVYDQNWNRIFRSLTEIDGVIDADTRFYDNIILPNKGNVVSSTLVDEDARRVYIAYIDGEIDYFSFDDNQLHDFVDSNNNIPVISIQPVGPVVLVEYKDAAAPSEFQLYQKNGDLSVVKATSKYPKPGLPVEIEIDGEAIIEFAQVFKLQWSLTRIVNDQPTDIDITTSDESLTLLSGQTAYGDILTVSFVDNDGVIIKEITVAVLDTQGFNLEKSTYSRAENLTIFAGTYNLNSADAREFIKVKWLKFDASKDSNEFQSLDLAFPFSHPASNAIDGDIITAEIYLKSGPDSDLLLETEFALILPNAPSSSFAFEYSEEPEFDASDKDSFQVEISEPAADDKYFSEHFTPVWLLDGEVLEGENSLKFPSNPDTNIKFGSILTISFDYVIGNDIGSTPAVEVITFDPDILTTKFNLFPKFPKSGDDITIDYEEFKEGTLSKYIPEWFINGIEDEAAKTLVYPGVDLKFGDHVELKLAEPDRDTADNLDPPTFAHTAEIYVGVNVFQPSLDDGIDSDGDTVLNRDDYFKYDSACFAESDGNPDDADGDGLSDLNELFPDNPNNRSNPNSVDSDQDGLSDNDEFDEGTDPNNADTDGDGFLDGVEVNKLGTLPLDNSVPVNSDNDMDRDGILNEDELALGTFVNNVDSDNDGLLDGRELTENTNPLDPDTDDDGLSDGLEVYVTKTDPTVKDSDGDGLSDGIEVRLLHFNPNDVDTNDDGVLDALEDSALNVGTLPANDYLNVNDLNDYAFGEKSSMVPAGTCYSTWLGQQELDRVVVSHEPQINTNSEQQILFAKYEWPEVIRYDAKNSTFLQPLSEKSIKGNITAIEYDVADMDIQYIGYLNGKIRTYDVNKEELTDIFDVGSALRILQIIDQENYLLVETNGNEAGTYTHYLFDKSLPIDPAPVSQIQSLISYKDSVWADELAKTERLLLGDVIIDELSKTRLSKETINIVSPQSISQSILKEAEDLSLKFPMFIEELNNEKALNFGSGKVLSLLTNEWLEDGNDQEITIMPFELGLQHDSLRITVPTNTSQILRNYQETLVGQNIWSSTQQTENDQVLSVVPVGIDTLVISYRTNGISQLYNQPPLAFELTSGDFDNDGLSDRLEIENGTDIGNKDTDGDGLTDGQEILLTLTDPLDTDSNNNGIFDGDEDRDGDGLSDNVELNETNTEIDQGFTNVDGTDVDDQNADADNDGLSNLIEVTQTLTNPSIKDTDSNGVEDGNEDFDQDGLTNLQELNNTLTSLIDPDSNNNGTVDGDEDSDADHLSDSLELNHIDPSTEEPFYNFELANSDSNAVEDGDEDFDGDALSNRVEVEETNTDPWLADSDGDGVNDGAEDRDSDGLTDSQEINITGTAFDNPDSDGDNIKDGDEDEDTDGLTDGQELQFSSSDYQKADSDEDGISDFDEVFTHGTNPMLKDTDGDTIDDNDEINVHESDPTSADADGDGLTDPLELAIDVDPQRPLFTSNPNLSDTDGDGLSDDFEHEYRFEYTEIEREEFDLPDTVFFIDPNSNDTDGDDLKDNEEIDLGLNPGLADTDHDKLSDFDEHHGVNGFKTDPKNRDSDGDGLIDGDEILLSGTDPLDTDSNDNGILDGDEDSDQDGLSDRVELNSTFTDIKKKDSDGDGLEDGLEDPDGDSLTNLEEVEKQTDPHLPDTDGDGVTDDEEESSETAINPDTDGDGLSDGEELHPEHVDLSKPAPAPTDPNRADTDGDGLSDFDERALGSDPNDVDTDNDFLLDGLDSGVDVLNWDTDSDGIPDGIEQHYLNTSPTNNDSDQDGLLDNEEVWVFAVAEDAAIADGAVILANQLISIGEESEILLNSRLGDVNFITQDFDNNDADRIVRTVIRAEDTADEIENVILYIRSVSRPDKVDTDGDGLTDFTELMQIEREFAVNGFDPNVGVSGYNPNMLNSENFKISDPWVIDTPDEDGLTNGINDGAEDIDGDFYTNVLEQSDENSDISNKHSDSADAGDPDGVGDGLLDGIEVLLLLSHPGLVDTDEDGLNDNEELSGVFDDNLHADLKSGPVTCRVENADSSVKCLEIPDDLATTSSPCSDTEIVLPNIAGITYCFSINFDSLPSEIDSDDDGVLDLIDAFALDASCSLATDGFLDDTTSKKQCFSSWMAQQNTIEQIGHAQWVDDALVDQAQLAFFSEGWDKVVRFDTMAATYLTQIEIDESEGAPVLVKVDYSPLSRRLYLAYAGGLIKYIDLVSGAELELVSDASELGATLDTIVVAGTSVIVQLKSATEYTHKMFNAAGQQAITNLSGSEDFNLKDTFWDQATSRLYGFKQAVGQVISNLGFVNIDETNNLFNGGIVYSPSLSAEADLSGPIALSQDGVSVYLGSGHKRLAGLGENDDVDPSLVKTYKTSTFNSFRELIELGGHFVGVVDINTGSDSLNPPTRNGIFIEDIEDLSASGSVNNSYLDKADDDEEVLKLVPFINGESELIFVSKYPNSVTIDSLGLKDEDGDGMSGIYETFYGLNDADADDRFSDPDADSLTNIEEFNLATDPLKEDTDGDTWDDAYEVINSTDPLNAADF